ncbi:MAG: hypothetical protein RL757_1254, partial [Bacteroidota bacterium]
MRSLFIFTCLIISQFAFAQKTTLRVHVSADGMPVAYANVYFPALKIGGVTDSLGSCEIEKIPSGNQLIKISFIGYFEQQKNIELKNAVEILDIELKSDGNSLNEVVITGNMKEVGKSQSVVPVEIYTAKFFEK